MACIDVDAHPHILDQIITHASYNALLSLRAASTALRNQVDALLLSHIAAFNGSQLVFSVRDHGKHHRIPHVAWLKVPALANAVKVVDICTTPTDKARGQASARQRQQAFARAHQARHKVVSPPNTASAPPARCWCNQPLQGVPELNARLAAALHCVQLIRQWCVHECDQAIAAPRTVTFGSPWSDQDENKGRVRTPIHVVHDISSNRINLSYQAGWVLQLVVRIKSYPNPVSQSSAAETGPPRAPGGGEVLSLGAFTWGIARAISQEVQCTVVGFSEWLEGNFCDDESRCRIQLVKSIQGYLVQWHYVEPDDAPDLIARLLRFFTMNEYRAAIGEELYALEEYCPPPAGEQTRG